MQFSGTLPLGEHRVLLVGGIAPLMGYDCSMRALGVGPSLAEFVQVELKGTQEHTNSSECQLGDVWSHHNSGDEDTSSLGIR